MTLTITVTDVLGHKPAGKAELALKWQDGAGDHAQTLLAELDPPVAVPLPPDWKRLSVAVNHPDYAPESVTVTTAGPDAALYWDNRGCLPQRGGADVTLVLEVGRVRQAPLTAPPFNNQGTGDQNGVFFTEGRGQPRRYASLNQPGPPLTPLWLDKIKVRTLQPPKSPPPVTLDDPGAANWGRFLTKDDTVALADTGGFLWLEYGSVTGRQPGQPRFLIAVWAPRLTDPLPKDGIDTVVYFSPSTATGRLPRSSYPFRTNYPYTVSPAKTADQPYVVLGYRHLMRDTMLIQEQAASGRPAVVVMPVFPAVPDGDAAQLPHMWQPFKSQEGLHRLLLEVVHFLHRFGYGRPGADFASWQGSTAPVDQLPPFPAPGYSTSTPQPPPALRNVTVAGFSTAIMGVNPVLTTAKISLPDKYPPALFGGADPAAFTAAWRELWDLDFALDTRTTGIRTADYEKGVIAWLRAGNDRRLRLYHCGYTTGNVPPAQLFPRLAKLPKTVSGPTPAPRRAEEWHDPDGRWSAVFYNSPYLQADSGPADVRPFFPPVPRVRKPPDPAADAADVARIHPFTATLGFGHASKLRKN